MFPYISCLSIVGSLTWRFKRSSSSPRRQISSHTVASLNYYTNQMQSLSGFDGGYPMNDFKRICDLFWIFPVTTFITLHFLLSLLLLLHLYFNTSFLPYFIVTVLISVTIICVHLPFATKGHFQPHWCHKSTIKSAKNTESN